MAKCTGCGNEVAGNARFCPLCGTQAIAPPNASGATLRPPTGPNSNAMPTSSYNAQPSYESGGGKGKVYAAAAAGGVVVLIAAIVFAKMSGLLGAHQTEVPRTAVLNAPAAQAVPAPVMNAPKVEAPKPSAPVLQPPVAQGNPMPEDVIEYLRWLKRFEAARQQLKARSESQMVLLMGNMIKAPLEELMKEPDQQKNTISPISKEDFQTLSKVSQEWNQAAQIFQAKSPPNACAPLAGSYNNMLTTIIQQEMALQQTLESSLSTITQHNGNATPDVQTTLQKLYGERNSGGMSHTADAQFTSASGALDALRARYTSMPPDIDGAHFTIVDESHVSVPNAPMMPGMGF